MKSEALEGTVIVWNNLEEKRALEKALADEGIPFDGRGLKEALLRAYVLEPEEDEEQNPGGELGRMVAQYLAQNPHLTELVKEKSSVAASVVSSVVKAWLAKRK